MKCVEYGTPEQYRQVPLTRYPPSTATAAQSRPDPPALSGAIKSPAGPNSSIWAFSEKCAATIREWPAPRHRHQPMPGSAVAISIMTLKKVGMLSLIHISEPTRQAEISYAV